MTLLMPCQMNVSFEPLVAILALVRSDTTMNLEVVDVEVLLGGKLFIADVTIKHQQLIRRVLVKVNFMTSSHMTSQVLSHLKSGRTNFTRKWSVI